MKIFWRVAVVAAVLACIPAYAADLATPAVVKSNVNVRGGPNSSFPVVGQLTGGSSIQVLSCNGPWCQIAWPGRAFVFATFLEVVPVAPVMVMQAPLPVPVAPAIVIAPPTAPLVYAAPPPVLYYPAPPRYYGAPPAPGPLLGGVSPGGW